MTLATSENGYWHSISIEPPLLLQPGDKLRQIGSQILHERNGSIIAIRDIGVSQKFEPELTGAQTVSQAVFFRRTHMAGVTVAYTGGVKVNDTFSASYSDGTSTESGLESLVQEMQGINQNYELAKQLLISAIIAREPSMNDPNRFAGSSISVDMSAAKQIQITLVDNFGN